MCARLIDWIVGPFYDLRTGEVGWPSDRDGACPWAAAGLLAAVTLAVLVVRKLKR